MTFYTYLWLREDCTPYYVGKGTGRRAWRSHKHHRPPNDLTRIIVLHAVTEQEAFDKEKELITLYGRKGIGTGCLRNMTEGGDGMSGYTFTPEQRYRVGLASKGRNVGHKHSEETRRLIGAGQPESRSEEFCRAVSAGKTGKPKRAPYTCPARKGKPWTEARRAAQERRKQL